MCKEVELTGRAGFKRRKQRLTRVGGTTENAILIEGEEEERRSDSSSDSFTTTIITPNLEIRPRARS